MSVNPLNAERAREKSVEPMENDEIAESVKTTMQALEQLLRVSAPRQLALRAIGSEFGHIVARNISDSNDPDIILNEIATFWNGNALGEMNIEKGNTTIFTLRNCFECLGEESADLLCGFKEGFVNAILNDRTGGLGSVEEVECCAKGANNCKFRVKTVHHEPQAGIEIPVLG
jgi:predicted hydrocarbon binding protein